MLLHVFADLLGHGAAHHAVGVLFDLLGLSRLLDAADLFLLVAADLPLVRLGMALGQLLANPFLVFGASLSAHLAGSRAAAVLLVLFTFHI